MTTPVLSVIMPVRGRAAQTATLIPRLYATAGPVAWELIVVVDDDDEVAAACRGVIAVRRAAGDPAPALITVRPRAGYWHALATGSQHAAGRLLANIANDVLPGLGWASRVVRTFDRLFPDGHGVVAWNDGLLFDGHAGHMVIGRALAEAWYGSACWPTCYDHLWGDVELCQRAMATDQYAVDLQATMYHNHFILGQSMDAVYQYSHRAESADRRMFELRLATGWPSPSTST